MQNTKTIGEKEELAYYTMSMPDWFLDLPYEEKIQLAQKFAKSSSSDQVLKKDDVLSLLSDSETE